MVPTEKNKRILIVDNDHDVLDMMEEALTYEGYEVNGLIETNDIFPEIMRYRPDIIILDYILNGINGGELCHQIKKNHYTNNIPVILMSAYPRVFNSLGNYGCDSFIPKPFNLDELAGCIYNLTNVQQTHSCHVR